MIELELTDADKLALFVALQEQIAVRAEKIANEVLRSSIESTLESLSDIKQDTELLNKLAKAGWAEL